MTTIYIIAGTLGVAVPFLMAIVLYKGIERSLFTATQKARYKTTLIRFTLAWSLLVWGLGFAGAFSYHPGDVLPRFVIPLMAPVAFGLLLLRNQNFRTILNNTPLSIMVGMQTFRLLGVLFILVVNAGLAPDNFVTGGYGDIVTGSLALLGGVMLYNSMGGAKIVAWLFMAAGIIDLLNVAFMLLLYYPIWSAVQPSSAGAAEFPLVLVLGLAAPVALTFHFYTLRSLLVVSATAKSAD